MKMGPLEFLDKSHNLGLLNFKKEEKNFGSLQRKIDNKYKKPRIKKVRNESW